MLGDESAKEGDWLLARDQSAGRGRQGRSWAFLPGNFAGSTPVEVKGGDPPASSLSLVAGLALIEAIDAAAPGRSLLLKWPNDVLLDGGKLAGILLERSGDRIAAGFGVNLAAAPVIEGRATASLGGTIRPEAFAPLLAASFARLLALWRSNDPAVVAKAWLARAHPHGARLAVHAGPGETLIGRFDGIEPDGALRLARDDGNIEIVRAGDVEL